MRRRSTACRRSRQKYGDDLAALDAGRHEIARLEKARAEAQAAYIATAGRLSAEREKSAKALEKAVAAELPPLKLERAELRVDLKRDETLVAASGYDRAEFLVRTNPGSRLGPLMKVASGGELARFLLALKVRLSERSTAPTLVFDEIDTGVGGAVADAMGQRLARLAEKAQVLAVTHAPQVAAPGAEPLSHRQIGGRRRRAGRDQRRASRPGRPARRDRPDAGRGRDHSRGARGCGKSDRKSRMTAP